MLPEKKSLTAFVFARGGSKGVPNKNIRDVAGKPLIAHTIATAFESQYIGKVIVSTDSAVIAQAAKESGAEVLDRPKSLAEDATPEIEAWRHAIDGNPQIFAQQKVFISLPATSPLRTPQDIDAGIEAYAKGGVDIVFSITPSRSSPFLGMVKINDAGHIEPIIESNAFRRQDVPKSYDIVGAIYATSPEYVQNCSKLTEGRCGYVVIPQERSLDIDVEYDIYLADFLLRQPFRPCR